MPADTAAFVRLAARAINQFALIAVVNTHSEKEMRA
jgi:hypothetical protein